MSELSAEHELAAIPGSTVRRILEGNEDLVLDAVSAAYMAHGRGQTKTPGTQPLYTHGGRFFAMSASLEDDRPIVGAKWVGSFVSNVAAGGERASALLIANDAETGRPRAIVDGTLISAKRTAAGAAVALRHIVTAETAQSIALVGCGPINYEVLRFVSHLFPARNVILVDLDPKRADAFAARLHAEFPSVTARTTSLNEALETADVVSMATNATVPHIAAVPRRPFVILHISLRDLAPSIIADAYNIVDDVEHVCRARTSVHLAAMETGRRDFIRGTISDLISGALHYERPEVPTIVSPFGLAILDLAVLREVLLRTNGNGDAIHIAHFRDPVWR
jgi:2,3-diaminopropionate biosynthesis protein SbnB